VVVKATFFFVALLYVLVVEPPGEFILGQDLQQAAIKLVDKYYHYISEPE